MLDIGRVPPRILMYHNVVKLLYHFWSNISMRQGGRVVSIPGHYAHGPGSSLHEVEYFFFFFLTWKPRTCKHENMCGRTMHVTLPASFGLIQTPHNQFLTKIGERTGTKKRWKYSHTVETPKKPGIKKTIWGGKNMPKKIQSVVETEDMQIPNCYQKKYWRLQLEHGKFQLLVDKNDVLWII